MGKPMNYQSNEEIIEDFEEYVLSVKENPRVRIDYVGRDGNKVKTPLETPLTVEGFENFVYNKRGFAIHDYMYSTDERYKTYSTIITHVKKVIRQDQIEGGMVGQYHSNLTARITGLKEQTETTASLNHKVLNIDPLADDDSTQQSSEPKE